MLEKELGNLESHSLEVVNRTIYLHDSRCEKIVGKGMLAAYTSLPPPNSDLTGYCAMRTTMTKYEIANLDMHYMNTHGESSPQF